MSSRAGGHSEDGWAACEPGGCLCAQITTYSVFLQKTPTPDVRQREDWGGEREPPEDALEGVPERAEPSFTEQHEQFATCMVLEYADRGGRTSPCRWYAPLVPQALSKSELDRHAGTLEKAVVSGKFRDRGTRLPDLVGALSCIAPAPLGPPAAPADPCVAALQKAIHRTLLDIAGGMDYLHSVGVLHGDLKASPCSAPCCMAGNETPEHPC